MRNKQKTGIVVFAAIVIVALTGCNNSSTSGGGSSSSNSQTPDTGSNTGSGDIEYYVDWWPNLDNQLAIEFLWSTDEDHNIVKHIKELLQFSDLIFTPNDVIQGDGVTTGVKSGSDSFKKFTVLKPGTVVTVTIKPIDGHKFYPDTSYNDLRTKNGNQITVTTTP